ncbi:MAG: Valine-tRNA ligase [Parcubacteria group bacterium GW2011_GWB1_49_7]|nr:MAG: Valine-tRNA ligase [Candidatus Pacebacteria bacterium GW2011_GWA1_46_10]KKW09927.1 MAG: Valine-tRNA ligase [Parcubacteria group bacterium GW2011_GWB1_49_7]
MLFASFQRERDTIWRMDSRYDHSQTEAKIYQLWAKSGAFAPAKTRGKGQKPFTIIMPPPNANDPLHVGHAMFVTIEDILIRFHRMLGDDALWLPGTDHAGIETQFVFEKKLKKEGKSRFDFDRETLYQMIGDYVQENSGVALDQMKKLGASADWSRFVFTLDKKAVDEALKTLLKLHQDGLLYRDEQLVNYCTHCGTAFSNLEVEHEQRPAGFYKIKYGPFVIATARPETKFRDTALAVNPKDKRYKKHIGQTLEVLGLLGPTKMTVIADEHVDPEFGTGIMKVTPAHDPHDFELGKKHHLPVTPIITLQGRMDFSWFLNDPANDPENPVNKNLSSQAKALKTKYWQRAQKYHGLKVKQMHEEMREDLMKDGLLVDYNPNYTNTIAVCYRCQNPIEPLPLPQFFIKVKPLVEPVLQNLKNKKFRVYGAGYDKTLKHWLKNLNDWNISRQIVWGIRMPAWYSTKTNPDLLVTFLNQAGQKTSGQISELLKTHSIKTINQGLQELRAPLKAEYVLSTDSPGAEYLQETDTLDTWFSSSQWPFTTLKSLSKEDFKRFYPTQVMETAYDILVFWVMRMLFMGQYATGQLPFTDIYLHGLIRDAKGQKMSKSKGNVVNPLTVAEKYGADALRMALVIRSTAGLDKAVGEQDFRAGRNLTNKIWNASRFILGHLDKNQTGEKKLNQQFAKKLSQTIQTITQNLNQFQIGLAADTVYNQFWHWYCDECIELGKANKLGGQQLLTGLRVFLKLMHPFVPFVTEAVWQVLRQHDLTVEPTLIGASWPTDSLAQ